MAVTCPLRHRECYVVEGVLQRMEVIPEVDVVQRYRTILVVGITGEQLSVVLLVAPGRVSR